MLEIIRYHVKVLHSAYLVLIFPLIFIACVLAWCIHYQPFCSTKEWCKTWSGAIKDIWHQNT